MCPARSPPINAKAPAHVLVILACASDYADTGVSVPGAYMRQHPPRRKLLVRFRSGPPCLTLLDKRLGERGKLANACW